MMRLARPTLVAACLLAALAVAACSDDADSGDPTPTAEPESAPVVGIAIRAGCDRPEPERGTEALALVRVTDSNGVIVFDAEVEGAITGPAVAASTATDVTSLEGEALLLFPVTANGVYTMTVTRVTILGEDAAFDPASERSIDYEISDTCVRP